MSSGNSTSLTLADAAAAAQRFLDGLAMPAECEGFVVTDDATLEFDEGWIFFWDSTKHQRTGEFRDALGGNAPVFVARDGSLPCTVAYHRPYAESMAAWRFCGDVNAPALARVVLKRVDGRTSMRDVLHAIDAQSLLGLGEAKRAVDACLAGVPTAVAVVSVEAAGALVDALAPLGVFAERAYGH